VLVLLDLGISSYLY